jgi:hypothetical protein
LSVQTTISPLAPARGIRNRSPGNLRHSPAIAWQGELAPDADGYCRFDSDLNGIRAAALDILTKWRRDGLRTVRAILARYAPPAENPTANYVANVAAALAVKPDDPLDLSAAGSLALFVKAVIRQECGAVPYTIDTLMAAVNQALAPASSSPSA